MNELYEFQLLRPLWLLSLLPVLWLLWLAWRAKIKQGAWHQVIDPKFRHLLLGDNQQGEVSLTNKLSIVGLGFIWLLAIIALSGPSIKSVEMPAEKNQQGSVIVLDLSLSMLADDLAPNRLSRVKYKITDLLKRHPELSVGMVGYAGSAHAISPISEDNQTLLGMLPALNPVIMPSYGADPLQGFEKAKALFKGAHVNHGHIIWITDDIENHQLAALKTWIKQHDYSVSILTVGTASGGAVQIPNYGLLKDDSGKIILPSLPFNRFDSFTQLDNVRLNNLNISDDSVKFLVPPMLAVLTEEELADLNKTSVITPLDEGVLLLFLLVPLVALLYRRGWVLNLSTISLPLGTLMAGSLLSIGLFNPTPSYAETLVEDVKPTLLDAFKSPDQQGYQAWKANNIQAAESLFEDEQWRASSQYRLGKFKEAAELFAKDKSPTGQYNLGNALAKSGQLEAAKTAYETALNKQPDFTPAQKNLEIIEQLLKQQKEQQHQQNQNQKKDQKKSEQSRSDEKSENQQSDDSAQADQNDSKSSEDHSKQDASESQSQQGEKSQSDLENEEVPKPDSAEESDQAQDSNEQKAQSDQAETEQSKKGEETQDINQLDEKNENSQGEQDDPAASKLSDDKSDSESQQQAQSKPPLTKQQQEQQQATQNWLKQIPDDPGLFLKRKFEYQYQQQSNQAAQSDSKQKQW